MKCVACLVALLLFVVVEGTPAYRGLYAQPYYFAGTYPGHCGHNDGMYYNDHNSFVVCTNGNAIVQPCAPGSANGPVNGYKVGEYYNGGDFCTVNLNDIGYSVYNGYHGYNGYYPYGYHHGYAPYGYQW